MYTKKSKTSDSILDDISQEQQQLQQEIEMLRQDVPNWQWGDEADPVEMCNHQGCWKVAR